MGKNPKTKVPKKKINYAVYFKNNWQLYVLILPAIIYFIVFNYMPLYGIQIAFKDFKAVFGISGSKWVGFKHFENFFHAYYFKRLLANTLLLNVYNLLWSFPVPIILAILLNQIKGPKIKRFIQTSIYVPYFISTVVLAGMLYIFLSPTSGIFNILRQALEEAAEIDGCGKAQTIFKIILPLSVPSLISTGLYAFINAWNEFMFGYIFISTDKYRTLTPAIMLFKGANTIDWGGLMAGSVIAVIPVTIIFLFLQKYFLAGLMSGSVKG